MTEDTRREVGSKVGRKDTGGATHTAERGSGKDPRTADNELHRVLVAGPESRGDAEIDPLHVNGLIHSLKNPGGRASFDGALVEGCYAKLAALLTPENEELGVKSVNGVAYCSLNQAGVTNLFGWIDSWPVAKNFYMVATKEAISKAHTSPVDHMIMKDKRTRRTRRLSQRRSASARPRRRAARRAARQATSRNWRS